MTPKHLRNRKTGVVFVHTPTLAKHPDMEPFEWPEAASATLPTEDGGAKPLAKMTKAEIIEAAEANFGVDLDPNLKADELRAELAKLMEAGS